MLSINCAEAQWEWQNPLPQGNNLNDIFFTCADTGFAVGDFGTLMKTTDAGLSWEVIELDYSLNIHSVIFTDNHTGFISGGDILKTEDGGLSWNVVCPWNGFTSLSFPDIDTGYAVTEYGEIYRTIDGGDNWSFLTGLTDGGSYSIFFTDCNTGYVNSQYKILKTTDSGSSWTECSIYMGPFVFDMHFLNSDTGFVVSGSYVDWPPFTHFGSIFKTEDGGLTWTCTYGSDYYIESIYFTSNTIGFASGEGNILKSTDGGNTWQIIYQGVPTNSVFFTDDNTGFAAGVIGTVLKTIDGGNNWNGLLPNGTTNTLKSVYFPDSNMGYAVGDQETILKTSNGGSDWTIIYSDTGSMNSVFFTNINTGYIASSEGRIYKTTDEGNTWTITRPISEDLLTIHFPSSIVGYTVSDKFILETNNAGSDWSIIQSNLVPEEHYTSIFFTDDTTGYVTGSVDSLQYQHGFILKTTDGGETWTKTLTSRYRTMNSIYFPSKLIGYAVGQGCYKTQDGGITWLYQDISAIFKNFLSVYFITDDIGYVTSKYGEVCRTMNGGTDWYILQPTTNSLNSIFFINDSTGYSVGAGGTILKTTNSGGSVSVINKKLSPARLLVYPNPATSTISINAAISGTVFIVNMKGQLLLQSHISGTNPSMDISALPKGIYVVKAVSDKGVQVGKFIKHL